MPAILLSILSKLVVSLVTETFVKSIIFQLAHAIAKKTQNDVDDQIVEAVRQAWSIPK